MWLAAQDEAQASPWFLALMSRLAEAEPTVLALLADDPFGDRPPTFLRARLVRYRFTSLSELRDGLWWHETTVGEFVPAMPAGEYVRLAERLAGP